MASVYSDIATTQNDSKGMHERANATPTRVGELVAVYTGEVSAGDEVFVARTDDLIGAVIDPNGSYVLLNGDASAMQIDLGEVDYDDGTADAATKYGSNVALTADGSKALSSATMPDAISKAGWIAATVDSETASASGDTLTFVLKYRY